MELEAEILWMPSANHDFDDKNYYQIIYCQKKRNSSKNFIENQYIHFQKSWTNIENIEIFLICWKKYIGFQ